MLVVSSTAVNISCFLGKKLTISHYCTEPVIEDSFLIKPREYLAVKLFAKLSPVEKSEICRCTLVKDKIFLDNKQSKKKHAIISEEIDLEEEMSSKYGASMKQGN